MIVKTLSLNTANIRTSSKTNKQKQYFFDTKTNFFQLRKIFTSEYTTNTLQALTENLHSLLASFLPKHTNQQQREERLDLLFFKNRVVRLHPFPLFLSLSSFSFFLHPANAKHYLHAALHPFIFHLFACRSLHKQTQRVFLSFLCFALFLRFSALCGFIFAFGAFICRFLFPPQPTHPTPISRYRIGGYPIP